MSAFRRFLVLALSLAALAGSPAVAASLDAPLAAGMRDLGGGIYADPAMPEDEAASLARLVERARNRVALYYGDALARPRIVFCASDDCYCDFGAVGLGFSDGANVVISPRGRRVAIVAHELAHVELSFRVGGLAEVLARVPQWFDEGQAVMVSMAEEFSDGAWQEAADGQRVPSLDELAALEDWLRLTGAAGENMQMTYGTARREVSRWFTRAGPEGLVELLGALRRQESFGRAYARAEAAPDSPDAGATPVADTRQPGNPPSGRAAW